jgi:hypothetical protein
MTFLPCGGWLTRFESPLTKARTGIQSFTISVVFHFLWVYILIQHDTPPNSNSRINSFGSLLMRVGRWAVSVFLNECWKLFANRDCASIHVSTFWNLISVYTLSFLLEGASTYSREEMPVCRGCVLDGSIVYLFPFMIELFWENLWEETEMDMDY